MGYFFEGSRFDGFQIKPYKSVVPSLALPRNRSGDFQPALTSSLESVCSKVLTCEPSLARFSTETAGKSGRDKLSIKEFRSGEKLAVGVAFSVVSRGRPLPSKPTT